MKAPSATMGREQAVRTLLARIAAHDGAALSELYERYAPALLGVGMRILRDRSAAHQVVEGVFARLWREARAEPGPEASVAAWLVVRVRNAAVDRRRAVRKLPPLARYRPDPLQNSFAWLPRPEDVARLEERRDLLKKIVNQLPKPQRQALELAVFEGDTEAEIAAKLGEPLGRVQAALRAGMRFLRHRLHAVLGTWAVNI
jgi:RNA polymerase sigma-70 factor (ECF subfamily)